MGWWGQFSSGGVEAVGSGWLELFLVMSSLLGCGEGGGVEDDPDDTLGMGQLGGDGDTGLDGGDVDEADLVPRRKNLHLFIAQATLPAYPSIGA